jgi:integrase/recombinase XerD
MNFNEYLEQNSFVSSNITRMNNTINKYLEWLPTTIEKSQYKHLMDYIGYLQNQEQTTSQINRVLQTISHYYAYKELPNIAVNTRVKGSIYKAIGPTLSAAQLDDFYNSYEVKSTNYYKHSDKLVLGLIIYQAIEMGDCMTIELKDVNLATGTIYIPQRGQRNSRIVALKSHQILPLHIYITEYRNTQSDKLLSPQSNDYHQVHHQMKCLSKSVKAQAKAIGYEITKLSHLRQSRIAIWTKQEGVRTAQYLAGFRRVLSAERYRKEDMGGLKEQVMKYHPMK